MNPDILRLPVGDNPPTAHLYYGRDVRETLRSLPEKSVQTICTSPPYWGLRDYGTDPTVWGGEPNCVHDWADGTDPSGKCSKCGAWRGSLGLEPDPDMYIEHLVEVFREARRVLRDDGTVWLNLGDTYAAGYMTVRSNSSGARVNPKDLVGIPWMAALALQDDGWYLRSDIIWSKPNPIPEAASDRPSRNHEYIFLLSKRHSYFYDQDSIREPYSVAQAGPEMKPPNDGRNRRSVWVATPKPYSGAHSAVWPPDLVRIMVLAGSAPKACPKCGAGWLPVTEKGEPDPEHVRYCGASEDGGYKGVPLKDYEGAGVQNPSEVKRRILKSMGPVRITGWGPSCNCEGNDGSARSVVMDLFSGSGTTGMVALANGRDYIGIDLNPEFLSLAHARILGSEAPEAIPDTPEESVLDLF